MSDYAETITLADCKLNDRWIGIGTIGPVTINGSTPSAALTRVVMNFRLGATTYTLDTAGTSPGIVISNAATWVATIAARDDFLPRAGLWEFDLEFYFTGATSPYTLYRGQIRVHDEVD